jgi:hypothetical protein
MKTAFVFLVTGIACCALLPGCASKPTPPAAPRAATAPVTPPAPVQPVPPAEPAPPADLIPAAALAQPPAPFEGIGWESLFDGQTLTGWSPTPFAGHGEVEVRSGVVRLNMGDPFTGINYTNPFPTMNYEVAMDAMRVMGTDFFCGLTVPVGDSHCSLIVGGWGGSLLGISSLDRMDASENETTKYMTFERGRWYRVRLRITKNRIEGWIDNEKKIDVVTTDRKISTRPGDIELSKPFGIASWQTGAALREIRYRKTDTPADPVKGPR